MKTGAFVILLPAMLLLLISTLQAKEMDFDKVKEGSIVVSFPVDLNGDGKMEKVKIKAYNVTKEDYFGQLVIVDSKGVALWEGPRIKDRNSNDPFFFGAFMAGIALPEVVADIDGDGKVEMLSSSPMSDVRPQYFLEFRWDGIRFNYVQAKALMETSQGSGVFTWQKPKSHKGGWIMSFESASGSKTFTAHIFSRYGDKEMVGKAEVGPAQGGFKVIRWIETLKPVIM